MGQILLREGLVVVARGHVATVNKCLPNLTIEVVLKKSSEKLVVDIDEIEHLPSRDEDNINLLQVESLSSESVVPLEELQAAQSQFDLIKRYLAKELNLTQALEQAGVSNGTFYRNIKFYDEEIGPASLLRMKRGNKKGSRRLIKDVDDVIKQAIKEAYIGKSATIAAVFRKAEELSIRLGLKPPSRSAISARLKDIPEKERHLRKHGHEATSQKYAARPGKKEIHLPLEWVQMDHTRVDLILVDQITRRPIGRPWLTVLIDLKTRVILGYYLSLYPPSSLSVACAVAHAALPKNQFLKRLGVSAGLHPYYGVPKLLHMDNASEFKTVKFQRACVLHKIGLKWRPIGAKHYGGHVERLIGTLMTDYVHFLPGTTHSNPVSRRGYDSEKNSALTFKEFCQWFAGQVAIYHGRKHKGLGRSPAAEWKSHFVDSENNVTHPPIISDPWTFRLDFMPEMSRKIHPQGVTLNGKWYWSPGLTPHIGKERVVIKYDPHSMATIWARLDGGYIPLYFSDVTTSDFAYEEHRALLKFRRKEGVTPDGALEDHALIDLIQKNEQIVKGAVTKTKRARKIIAAKFEHETSTWIADETISATAPDRSDEEIKKPDYSKKATPYSRRS
ncbi:Mu transposase C-terminal domain-containing protein [Pseudomonas aeruginosa]|uniref:Mu transposase C-terminal domain-containing protein n=1 Tax=Pseudomonas aeruginosa TaxID=287 RepID=UPI0014193DAB|nr:Mu transposase C-terminal domain-containing protein [Pseudomonas aeruginosa]MCS9148271.1 Mu transposase C-terminal domain-containing protein [Pseudomonas aeruginosa]MCS9684611.1 Mu transposase C-terminal domain-containing protein [Pseudomonas aeruginosa]MCS9697444.1 Mu transposase C-terminal domain-containing protein [Pseudomonas aeruginosa]